MKGIVQNLDCLELTHSGVDHLVIKWEFYISLYIFI